MAALGCQEQRPQLHGKVLSLDSLCLLSYLKHRIEDRLRLGGDCQRPSETRSHIFMPTLDFNSASASVFNSS